MIETELSKSYTPADVEGEIRRRWDDAGAFHAEPDSPGEAYAVIIPPPNVTAALHLGHAFNNTLQDVLVRYHRMRGCNTLWMPGTDHAGIATQTVVEKRLMQSEGRKRTDYSRDEFIAKVQAWKDEYEATIIDQLKAMGCSCDFDRTRFTMDDICAKAVREAFFQLFKDGLIYRGKRLVNWDPVTQTALADDEVEMQEVDGKFYYLRYPLVHPSDNPDDPFDCKEVTWSELAARGYPGAEKHDDEENAWVTVATTRPETYLGDTAVAMHPDDPRAVPLDGLNVQLPLVGRVIPFVRDEYVVMPEEGSSDPKAQFATGFLKVTPAHDPNDYDIGQRHDLEMINVMAPDASISDQHGWDDVGDAHLFVNMSREDAREKVVKEFEARRLLEAVKPYRHSVGHSYRSHVPVEPYLSDQWYVKVTDDRLKGAALRAMAPEQYQGTADGTGAPPVQTSRPPITQELLKERRNLPHWQLGGSTYFVTFRLKQGKLNEAERSLVLHACRYWHETRMTLHLATVMPDHVHLIFTPHESGAGPDGESTWHSISDLLHSIKSYTAHQIQKLRTASGALWQDESFDRIIRDEAEFHEKWNYVWTNAVKAGLVERPEDYQFTFQPPHEVRTGGTPVPPAAVAASATPGTPTASGGTATASGGTAVPAVRNGDGELRFFPDRYARTFQQWHENLRDWCISRQLWWGHRIPVWTIRYGDVRTEAGEEIWSDDEILQSFSEWLADLNIEDRVCVRHGEKHILICTHNAEVDRVFERHLSLQEKFDQRAEEDYAERSTSGIHLLQSSTLERDPDVLDTWFSSALWPLSTMGWPEPDALTSRDREGAEADATAAEQPLPDGRGSLTLLDTFNPTSVLCTAREIITLWVSRMVMFNRYFNDGKVPFRHVYIHAMIQDGHGQKMSKSLGNGVDPRDIISTHGTDALRFTLTQIATATQDVRLPVDLVCPHTGETFTPKTITTPAGHVVPAPIQSCPSDANKKMVTAYGVASGQAEPSEDMPLAINASAKFDLGRNFANKLWNAVRFALSNLEATPAEDSGETAGGRLVDRWMLARLHDTLSSVERAIDNYQFNAYAEAMYDLIWREFCDWYLEAIKPTVKDDPQQQRVLATMLNAMLRMLHPIMPFVTETLWQHVSEASSGRNLNAITLPESSLAATAAWPVIDDAVADDQAVATFERVQQLVEAIRTIRGERNIPRKKKLTLHVPPKVMPLVEESGGVVETMALLESVEQASSNPGGGAVPLAFEGAELYLTGLVDADDTASLEAERTRLTKFIAEKERAINGFRQKLSNENYVNKAPAHLVEETRAKLAEAEADWEAARNALESLDA